MQILFEEIKILIYKTDIIKTLLECEREIPLILKFIEELP